MIHPKTRPSVTYLLLFLNIFSYIYLALQSTNPLVIDAPLMRRYGFVKELFFSGAYWQVLTNMFTHFDIPHLGYNMVFLLFFSAKSEELFGRKLTLLFYLGFGFATTATAFFYPLGTVSAGASGAVFGLLGADLAAQRGLYPRGIWTSLLYGSIFFVFAAATGFLAHLVGLVIGFSSGYLVSRDWYPEEEEEQE